MNLAMTANLGPDWTEQHEFFNGSRMRTRTKRTDQAQEPVMPNIKAMMPSKYLKKEDCPEPVRVTVDRLEEKNVAPEDKPEELKWVMYFREFGERGMVMNNTNLQLAAIALGSEESDDWEGKQIVLYADPNVSFGGKLVGGLRIRQVKTRQALTKPAVQKVIEDDPDPRYHSEPKGKVPLAELEDDLPY